MRADQVGRQTADVVSAHSLDSPESEGASNIIHNVAMFPAFSSQTDGKK